MMDPKLKELYSKIDAKAKELISGDFTPEQQLEIVIKTIRQNTAMGSSKALDRMSYKLFDTFAAKNKSFYVHFIDDEFPEFIVSAAIEILIDEALLSGSLDTETALEMVSALKKQEHEYSVVLSHLVLTGEYSGDAPSYKVEATMIKALKLRLSYIYHTPEHLQSMLKTSFSN